LIVDGYLIREIFKPLVAIWTILVIIFASYTAAEYLADAANGLLLGRAVIDLVLFKLITGMEFLLPISLYLAVVVSVGRLYADAEMTALHACGIGINRVLGVVFGLSIVFAVVAASLSLYVRPWAYEKFYQLRARASSEFDIARMEGGRFYEIRQDNRVIFAEEVDHERNRAKRAFIQEERGDTVQVILARQVHQRVDERSGKRVLVFLDGTLYELPRKENGGRIVTFERSTLSLPPEETPLIGYKRRAASTRVLAGSVDPRDIAEFQWRLSVPVTTLLLALLGVPLSRTAPRHGKYAKVAAAIIVYVVYYNFCAMAKSWTEQGVVGAFPGLWWVPALLAGFLLALLLRPAEGVFGRCEN